MHGIRGYPKALLAWVIAVLLLVAVVSSFSVSAEEAPPAGAVYVIPVEQTIESGLHSFLDRAMTEAEEAGASLIVLEIDTFGGSLGAAIDIGERVRGSEVPVLAFVKTKAISAGSYIALNADMIAMAPGGAIGDAAIVTASGERVRDSKQISNWKGHMEAAAEMNGRNKLYAGGMVDDSREIAVPEIGKTFAAGELITFTAEEARAAGYAETVAASIEQALTELGHDAGELVRIEPTTAEKIARVLTNPYVYSLLLIIGIVGIGIELFAPGFGVFGIAGVTAFGLYFFGHYVAGFAGVEHLFLFVVGVLLLLAEIFIPSFGILGLLGLISLCSGIVMAAYSSGHAALSLGIAVVVAIVVFAIFFKYFKHRGVWNRFILKDSLTGETGFRSQTAKEDLKGKRGVAMTVLRPAGTAEIEGERVDVVTSGEFIEAGVSVEVVQVEGARVVVRQAK